MKIELIPTQQLLKDKQESIEDIALCQTAINVNIVTYSGGSVRERLEVNKKIVAKIDKEFKKRGLTLGKQGG